MAAIGLSDVTYTKLKIKKIEDDRKIVDVQIGFGNGVLTYPAGGIPLNKEAMDCPVDLDFFGFDNMSSGDPFLYKHDSFANTIRIYEFSAGSSGGTPAPGSPSLGMSAAVEVLAKSTITNTGATVVTGNLDLSPGSSVTGFPPGVVVGVTNVDNPAAVQAQSDLTAAYTDLQGRAGGIDKSGIDMGTLTLAPGIYKWTSSAQLTGTLVLDAGGNPNALWIFQIGTTLTTAASSQVSIINGGSASNVYFAVGTSATIGASAFNQGNIFASASISLGTSAVSIGRLWAGAGATGAVNLLGNIVSLPGSGASSPPSFGEMSGIVPATIITALAIGY